MKKFAIIFLMGIVFSVSSLAFAELPPGEVQMVPFQRDGKVIGLRLFRMTSDSEWAKAGYLNNDVIIAIDDIQGSDIQALTKALGSGSASKAKIMRDGKETLLDVSREH